jgi:transposase
VLALHRMRQQLVKFRTMQVNCLRGLLAEYGEVMGKGRCALDKAMPIVLATVSERLPAVLIDTLREQWNGLSKLDQQIATIERRLRAWMKEDEASKSIAAIPGVGLLTATAAVATRETQSRSDRAAKSRPGSAWYPDKRAPVARWFCWESARGAIPICGPF